MKLTVSASTVILDLLLMMCLAAARSLPYKQVMRMSNTDRDSGNVNTDSAGVAQLQSELADLSIPSYLKDLYINLTYPNGVARPPINHKETRINTVQTYKNQAKSKSNINEV